MPETYDVFLLHNSQDKAAVEQIAQRLIDKGIMPFLDKWHLVPGEPWQEALESELDASATVAFFVGPSGISPWHNEIMRAALDQAVRTRDEYRVIPVLLPGASEDKLTGFLARRTWVDFRAGLDDEIAFSRLVTGIRGEAILSGSFELPDEPAPYRGLLRFDTEQASFFFGRETETRQLVEKLTQNSFIAVIGASGSGKSSLVRAGLIPALNAGALPDSRDWHKLVLTPGSQPLRALANVLSTVLPIPDRVAAVDRWVERFSHRPDGFRTVAETLLAENPKPLLLVVDQFEEIFTQCQRSSQDCQLQAEQFIAILRDAAQHSNARIRIVVTLRADFLERCLAFPQLKEMLQNRQFLLGPMDDVGLREAIVRPAKEVGAFFEKGLVSAILRDVKEQSGVLPLLQYALFELWKARRGPWLTLEAYEESEGVRGALKRRAQLIYENLPPKHQDITRNIFLRLTSLDKRISDTRRSVSRDEFYLVGADPADVEAVLQALSSPQARLIVSDDDAVVVTHDALIREWDTLRDWLDEHRDELRIQHRLTRAAQEWDDLGRDPGALYRGSLLEQANEWAGAHPGMLNQVEQDFLETSQAAYLNELKAARQRNRRLAWALAIAVAMFLVAAFFGWRATIQTRIASARELAARSSSAYERDPELSLLLAVEAVNKTYRLGQPVTSEARAALYRALTVSRFVGVLRDDMDTITSVAFNADDSRIITVSADQIVRLWRADGELIARLQGQPGVAQSAVFSPDGEQLITWGKDGTVNLWDVDGNLLFGFDKQWYAVFAVRFSPDGERILVVGRDALTDNIECQKDNIALYDAQKCDKGNIGIYDANGVLLTRLKGPESPIYEAYFGLDGQRIVTKDQNGKAALWDINGEFISYFVDQTRPLDFADSDPTGRILTTSGAVAYLWDADGSLVAKLEGHAGEIQSARFGPSGEILLTSGATAYLWGADGSRIARLAGHTDKILAASFSPDGTLIATTSRDSTVRLWNADGKYINTLVNHTSYVWSAVFSPDGAYIVSTSTDRTARLWNARTGMLLATFRGHKGPVHSARFSHDGTRLITYGRDGTAWLWASENIQLVTEFVDPGQDPPDSLWSANFSPDGASILTAGDDGIARIWDIESGEITRIYAGHDAVIKSASFSPDGKLIVTASDDDTARLYDVNGDFLLPFEGHQRDVNTAVFHPDGDLILTASDDGLARLWDLEGYEQPALDVSSERTRSANFSPDGSYIVTAHIDDKSRRFSVEIWTMPGNPLKHFVRIWDMKGDVTNHLVRIWDLEGNLIGKLAGHTDGILSVNYSPDGKRIITASEDQTARLWTSDGDFLVALEGHTGPVWWANFSLSGELIVTASSDGTARLWDADGNFLTILDGHITPVYAANFSPDGTLVVTAGRDGTAKLWRIWDDIDALLAEAQQRVKRSLTPEERCQYLGEDCLTR